MGARKCLLNSFKLPEATLAYLRSDAEAEAEAVVVEVVRQLSSNEVCKSKRFPRHQHQPSPAQIKHLKSTTDAIGNIYGLLNFLLRR